VTRVISGAVMLAVAVGLVWFAPPLVFLFAAQALLGGACVEYAALARHSRFPISDVMACAAALITSVVFSRFVAPDQVRLDVVLMAAFIGVMAVTLARWRGEGNVLGVASASLFPALYLGLPIGAMIALREQLGREALALLMLTIVVSDTAQYYSGRAFGRRLLAPAISPKKTVAGAIGGFVFGALLLAVVGAWWLPTVPPVIRFLMGGAVVGMGIIGDLFESMLKRSAEVKDSSALIPGHGGILDRIDALLFAAPIYYIMLQWLL
jgi:phosphatidate cytidylyltransferase